MPYIKKEDRPYLETLIWNLKVDIQKLNVGDLNYLITQILLSTKPIRYSDYNRLIGVLECVKLEFYRRAVALYEDEKIKENGDVYETV